MAGQLLITLPSSISAIESAKEKILLSWVTTMTQRSGRQALCLSNSRAWCPVLASSEAVGSSQMINLGSCTRARAIEARWRHKIALREARMAAGPTGDRGFQVTIEWPEKEAA